MQQFNYYIKTMEKEVLQKLFGLNELNHRLEKVALVLDTALTLKPEDQTILTIANIFSDVMSEWRDFCRQYLDAQAAESKQAEAAVEPRAKGSNPPRRGRKAKQDAESVDNSEERFQELMSQGEFEDAGEIVCGGCKKKMKDHESWGPMVALSTIFNAENEQSD